MIHVTIQLYFSRELSFYSLKPIQIYEYKFSIYIKHKSPVIKLLNLVNLFKQLNNIKQPKSSYFFYYDYFTLIIFNLFFL